MDAPKRSIIAFCGLEGSGKDTAAKFLTQKGYTSVSFAYTLKKAVCEIFGWEFEMIEGLTPESRKWREEVDEFWSRELEIPGLTPRKVLQLIGTDIMRKHFSDKIWTVVRCSVNYTTAARPSEAKAIKEWGGKIIQITRECTKPAWYSKFWEVAISLELESEKSNCVTESFCTKCAEAFYEQDGVHPAETSLLLYDRFDQRIRNDSTLRDLKMNLSNYLKIPFIPIRNIAADFDDVISPFMFPFISYCNRIHGCSLHLNEIINCKFESFLKCTSEEAREIFEQFILSEEYTMMHSTAPSEECVRVLRLLSQKYKLFVITARESRFESVTRAYLEKYLPDIFIDVHFANTYASESVVKVTKSEICNLLDCQVLIDDNSDHIADAVTNGIEGVLFGDYPWNANVSLDRVKNWKEVEKLYLP